MKFRFNFVSLKKRRSPFVYFINETHSNTSDPVSAIKRFKEESVKTNNIKN